MRADLLAGRFLACCERDPAPPSASPACRSRTAARCVSWNAFCSFASSFESERPSIVSTRQPSACTASIRQPRTISPSTRSVQAPHTPCSQPMCEPVRPSSSRRKSTRCWRAATRRAHLRAVHRQRDVESVFHARSSRTLARCSLVAERVVEIGRRIEVLRERRFASSGSDLRCIDQHRRGPGAEEHEPRRLPRARRAR